jgi:hypothetical protein
MTMDERIEFLLRVQESHQANLTRLFELREQTEKALGRFRSRTDRPLPTVARIPESYEHRLTDLEGGAQ